MSNESFTVVTGSAQIMTVVGTVLLVVREGMRWWHKRQQDPTDKLDPRIAELALKLENMEKRENHAFRRVRSIRDWVVAIGTKWDVPSPRSS